MKQVFKIVALSLLAVVLIIIGVGALLPNQWEATEQVMVEAPPSAVFPYLEDFREWRQWATKDTQADLRFEYSGSDKGVGAVQSVVGERSHTGRMEIVRSEPARGIWYQTSSVQGTQGSGSITLGTESGLTTVTWQERGQLPMIWGGFMRDPTQKQIREYFKQSLFALKDAVEKSQSTKD